MHKLSLILILIIVMTCSAYASNLGVNYGIGLSYKTYSADGQITEKSGNRIDELYLETQLNRDFKNSKGGGLYLDGAFSKLHMNYFPLTEAEMTAPFAASDDAVSGTTLLYDYNARLRYALPQRPLRIGIQFAGKKNLVTENNSYFNGLSFIKTDVPELEGVETSLDRYDGHFSNEYLLHYYGKTVGVQATYTGGSDLQSERVLDYRTKYLTMNSGLSINQQYGVYVHSQEEVFNLHTNDVKRKGVKAGTINEFGAERPFETDAGDQRGYLWFNAGTVQYFDGIVHDDLQGMGGYRLTFSGHELELKGSYLKTAYDVANEELEDSEVSLSYVRRSPDVDYYLKSSYRHESSSLGAIDGSVIGYDNIEIVLLRGFEGAGELLFSSTGDTLTVEFQGLRINGEEENRVVVISPASPYVFTFTDGIIMPISGSVTVLTGNSEHLQMTANRTIQLDVTRDAVEATAGYYLRLSRSFRSKLDVAVKNSEVKDFAATGSSILSEDERELKVKKLFEIRPSFFIFDISVDHTSFERGESTYATNVITLKDGFYADRNRLYSHVAYEEQEGDGYDDIRRITLSLVGESEGRDYRIRLLPTRVVTNTNETNILTEDRIVAHFSAEEHSLRAYWEAEHEKDIAQPFSDSRNEYTLNYVFTNDNVKFDIKHRRMLTSVDYSEYIGLLRLQRLKRFPASEPYLVNETGYTSTVTKVSGTDSQKNDYLFNTTTYTPTRRLSVILGIEKQISGDDEGDDFEFAVKYRTRSFRFGIGYRSMNTIRMGEKQHEQIFYFEVRKGIGIGTFI